MCTPSDNLPVVRVLNSFAELHALIDPHRLAEPSGVDFFYTLAWFENLADVGLDAATYQLWLVGDPRAGPLVCLPVLADKVLTGLSNCFSSLFAPVVWGNPEGRWWDALGQALRKHPARWPTLSFSPLDMESAFFNQMQDALARVGYQVDRYFCFGNWYLRVEGRSFADYRKTLPAALRHSLDRGQRRLDRQGEWHLHIQQNTDDLLEDAITNFVAVYSQSWKGAEPNAAFIPGLARMAARQGWLRLGVLTLNGKAIAAQLWLVQEAKASIFKLAYVVGFEKFSAGSILTQAMMRHVIDIDGVKEVDYLTGDDAYKRDWMSHRRERWGIIAFDRRTFTGVRSWCFHFSGKMCRKILGIVRIFYQKCGAWMRVPTQHSAR